jgi:class 3 adenylate cyclase
VIVVSQYSFSTSNETIADFMRRTAQAGVTLGQVATLVRAGLTTLTDTQVFIDPEEVDELIGQLRGEVELIAETLGHMLDRNV